MHFTYNHKPFDEFAHYVAENWQQGINGKREIVNYISSAKLKEYWNPNRVYEILHSRHGHPIPLPLETICDRFTCIFSILVYGTEDRAFRVNSITKFLSSNIDDHNLPLRNRQEALDIFPDSTDGTSAWNNFDKLQFRFKPVSLVSPRRLPYKKDLAPSCILPLREGELISPNKGSKSRVMKYIVDEARDEAHGNVGGSTKGPDQRQTETVIVVKELDLGDDYYCKAFEKEVDAYLALGNEVGQDASKYFLKYRGSFKQSGRGHILLEYADEGSLDDFYKKNLYTPHDREELFDMWRALLKLVGGLRILHDLNRARARSNRNGSGSGKLQIIHQDLKPSNIFVFRDTRDNNSSSPRFVFKIGDFGLSSLEMDQDVHPDNKSTKMYGAPELMNIDPDMDILDEGITSAADIWSLGCIFFEMLVWQVCGERGRDEFFRRRQQATGDIAASDYEAAFHEGSNLNSTRLAALDEMLEKIQSGRRIFDNLTGPLAKDIFDWMLQNKPRDRFQAHELAKVLGKTLSQNEKGKQIPAGTVAPTAPNSAITPESNISSPVVTPEHQQGPYGSRTQIESPDSMHLGNINAAPESQFSDGLYFRNPPISNHQTAMQPQQPLSMNNPPSTRPTLNETHDVRVKVMRSGTDRSDTTITRRDIWLDEGFDNVQNTHSRLPQVQHASEHHENDRRPPLTQFASRSAPQDPRLTQPIRRSQQLGPSPSLRPGLSVQTNINRANSNRSRYNRSPIPRSNMSPQNPYPMTTIKDVLDWMERKKRAGVDINNLPGQDKAIGCLKGRQQIFIVDDTETLRKYHRREVRDTFKALAYLVKDCDPDGIELFLTSNQEKRLKARKNQTSPLVTTLWDALSAEPTHTSNVRLSLNRILGRVKQNIKPDTASTRSGSRFTWSRSSADVKTNDEISIYILTDAMWDGGDTHDNPPAAAEPIETLIKAMHTCNRSPTEISVQFIQFGNDAMATRRLRYLDNELWNKLELTGPKYDIVDHRRYASNVWHMLIGSIDRETDRLEDTTDDDDDRDDYDEASSSQNNYINNMHTLDTRRHTISSTERERAPTWNSTRHREPQGSRADTRSFSQAHSSSHNPECPFPRTGTSCFCGGPSYH